VGKRAQKAEPPALNMPAGWPHDYKLTIAWAGYGLVHTEFAVSLAVATKNLACPARLDWQNSCYVHDNRNMLLDRALESDSTHMMFVDTDIVFPPDGIQTLISRQKPIIGGAYNLKAAPIEGVTRTTVKALERDLAGRPHNEWVMDKSKPFECRGLPTGFMLIELDVLRQLEAEGQAPDYAGARGGRPGSGPRKWFDFAKTDDSFVGEDIYFCDYLRDRGVPIWCDPTIKLGHIGTAVF